jgi:hypothetical protein
MQVRQRHWLGERGPHMHEGEAGQEPSSSSRRRRRGRGRRGRRGLGRIFRELVVRSREYWAA